MMKKRKSLIVALSSLALIATSVGASGFKTYADENIGNFDTYTEADSKENSTDTITAYATSAKKKLTLRLERRNGDVQEISLGEHYDQGTNPNYYFSSINPIFSQYRAVVTHLSSGDDGGYILHAKEPGNLIVKAAADPSPSNNQVIPYKVETPTVSNPQTVTYTLPQLDDSDFYYQKTKADGGTEDINYDENNRTFTLTGDERFADTIVTIYSKGTKGLAETIQPIKKELTNKEDNIPTLENLLSCLDFGSDESKIDKNSTKISDNDKDKLKATAKPGKHNINIQFTFIDKSHTEYTVTINTIANPKNNAKPDSSVKPENNTKPDSSAKPENNAKPDSSAKPENNAKPDGSAKPENNAKPDSNTKPNNSSNSGNSGNSGVGSSSRSGSGGGGASGSRGSSRGSSGGGSSRQAAKNSSSTPLPSYVVKGGTWSNNNGHWQYKTGNTIHKDMWLAIENPFANEKLGQAKFSWFRFDKDGNMLTNWQWIKDEKDGKLKCYYLNPISNGSMGAMLSNTRTPDGFMVNAAGEWVVNGIVQTK